MNNKTKDGQTVRDLLSSLFQSVDTQYELMEASNLEAISQAEQDIEKLIEQRCAERERHILEALYSMYEQYCEDGHMFMSAGERASEILENYGYLETDGAGRIVKSNINHLGQLQSQQSGSQEENGHK